MIKVMSASYSFDNKEISLTLKVGFSEHQNGNCTLNELDSLIVQLQKARMMMVVDHDDLITKKLEENVKAPDAKVRSILLEEKPEEDKVPA